MSFEVAGKWQIQRKNVDLRARFPQVFYKLSTAAPTPAVLSCPARQPAADGARGPSARECRLGRPASPQTRRVATLGGGRTLFERRTVVAVSLIVQGSARARGDSHADRAMIEFGNPMLDIRISVTRSGQALVGRGSTVRWLPGIALSRPAPTMAVLLLSKWWKRSAQRLDAAPGQPRKARQLFRPVVASDWSEARALA
jgi:hypothetical protein